MPFHTCLFHRSLGCRILPSKARRQGTPQEVAVYFSCLNYCNSLCYGLLMSQPSRWAQVQNSAAWFTSPVQGRLNHVYTVTSRSHCLSIPTGAQCRIQSSTDFLFTVINVILVNKKKKKKAKWKGIKPLIVNLPKSFHSRNRPWTWEGVLWSLGV